MTSGHSVVLFGGQGSSSLFSSSAMQIATADAASSSNAASLLSLCYIAFLEEFESLGPLKAPVFSAKPNPFPTVESLLCPAPAYHNNAVIQSTTICLYQLLRFISTSAQTAGGNLEKALENTFEASGLCSGILPAAVVASSKTSEDFNKFGVEAFRLAFWIGYRSAAYRYKQMSGSSVSPTEASSSLAIIGMDVEELSREINSFHQKCKTETIHISVVAGERYLAVSGSSADFETFKDHCASTFSKSVTVKSSHIHGAYHGGSPMQAVVDEICADVKTRNINFPITRQLRKPLRSTFDGKYFSSTGEEQDELIYSILQLILVHPVNWTQTCEELSGSITAMLNQALCQEMVVHCLGPDSTTVLNPVKERLKGLKVQFVNHWQPQSRNAQQAPRRDDIAIVGMAGNYPLGEDLDAFWETISNGLSAVEEIPQSRFDLSQFYSEKKSTLGRRMATRHGNFVKDVWAFDHSFFNLSPREAKSMDPQQRVLLQVAQAALEDAGFVDDSTPTIQNKSIGCYIGVATGDYTQNTRDDIDVYSAPGNLRAFLSGRISYAFGLGGPSVVVDTACSSSMVAIYQACRAIQMGDCSAAIAGGVNIICAPDMYLGLARAHFLSQTGQCKPFDQSADGYCRGEGCGLFVLKPLPDAIAEGDRIHGVIKGIEVNQSGLAHSITHPHMETQVDLYQKLIKKSAVDVTSISVIEAHGTGTQAGDFSEVSGLYEVFGASPRQPDRPLVLSSVKGNIGHAEAAAGAAGLTKLLLMLRHKTIPTQASFSNINPRLAQFIGKAISIPTFTHRWDHSEEPRRALLNNFGAAGSNAALLLEEYKSSSGPNMPTRSAYPFNLSARSSRALEESVRRHIEFLDKEGHSLDIRDVSYTATARRQTFSHRLSLSCNSVKDLVKGLQNADGSKTVDSSRSRSVVFVFSGQGGSYAGMGKELMATLPQFADIFRESDEIIRSLGLPTMIDLCIGELDDKKQTSIDGDTEGLLLQCACATVEYALAKLWISMGVVPKLVIGHSLGEYVAMAISGALSWPDALRVVAKRALLMVKHCKSKSSGMLACRISPSTTEELILSSDSFSDLTVACRNSPVDCVVAGPLNTIQEFSSHCIDLGHKVTALKTSYGFHSAAMDDIVQPLNELGRELRFCKPTIAMASTVLGRLMVVSDYTPSYFANHTRQAVLFDSAIQSAISEMSLDDAIFLEIGPHPMTLPMVRNCLNSGSTIYLPSLERSSPSWTSLTKSLCQMFLLEINVNWRAVFVGLGSKLIDIPGHPLDTHEACIPYQEPPKIGTTIQPSSETKTNTNYALLPFALHVNAKMARVFETKLETISGYIKGHAVGGTPLCPASICYELALEAAATIRPLPADTFYVASDMTFTSPLVYAPSQDNMTIRVHLTEKHDSQSEQLRFRITSHPESSPHETEYCHGLIGTKGTSEVKDNWARKAAITRRQKEYMFERSPELLSTFQTRMLYDAIFTRVVAYSQYYQTLSSLSSTPAGDEGFGTFKIQSDWLKDNCVVPPNFSDTLLHAAGFIANTSVDPTEACICGKVDSIEIFHHDIDYTSTFTLYCSLSDIDDGTILADSWALDSAGRVIAVIEGMHFKRVRLASFKTSLERTLSRHSTMPASEVSPQSSSSSSSRSFNDDLSISRTSPAPMTPVSPPDEDNGFPKNDLREKILTIVSRTCGVNADTIREYNNLESLGVDSLMSLELVSAFAEAFPTCHIGESAILRCQTFDDLLAMTIAADTKLISVNMQQQRSQGMDGGRRGVQEQDSTTDRVKNKVSRDEGKVRELVASISGVQESLVNSGSSLSSLGIDSLLMVELQQSNAECLGLDIDGDRVLHCNTVGDLEAIAAPNTQLSQTSASIPSLVEIATATKKTATIIQKDSSNSMPLYLFHDGSGACNSFLRLQRLGRDTYGFAAADFPNLSGNSDSLVQLARRYSSNIAMSTTSQVLLGGWSFGGVVAFEVARQLLDIGRPVKGLLLIDAPYPRNHKPLPNSVIDVIVPQSKSSSRQEITRQFRHCAALLADYDCPPTSRLPNTKVVALKSAQVLDTRSLYGVSYPWLSSQSARDAAIRQWEELLEQEITVLDIQGDHFQAFDPENIEGISKQIRIACEMFESAVQMEQN